MNNNCFGLKKCFYAILGVVLFYTMTAHALTFNLPTDGSQVVGRVFTVESKPGDDFDKIAERYDVGFFQLIEANPALKPYDLKPNTKVIIPTKFVLPPPHKDIVINEAEFRFYYYPPHSNVVITYPIGIGAAGYNTPEGNYYIAKKEKPPIWIPTKVVRKKIFDEQGIVVPTQVGPGPSNPLGDYAMRLNIWTYLIHGTNEPASVGKRSSAGCIHLYPEDIAAVYDQIPLRTPVHIINTIYKAGWSGTNLYIQIEQPLSEQVAATSQNMTPMVTTIKTAIGKKDTKIHWARAIKAAQKRNGIPVIIGHLAGAPDMMTPEINTTAVKAY